MSNDENWREKLSPEQYRILREAGTERAFQNKYWDTKTPGTYACAGCGEELYLSSTKFDSGSGWPSSGPRGCLPSRLSPSSARTRRGV